MESGLAERKKRYLKGKVVAKRQAESVRDLSMVPRGGAFGRAKTFDEHVGALSEECERFERGAISREQMVAMCEMRVFWMKGKMPVFVDNVLRAYGFGEGG